MPTVAVGDAVDVVGEVEEFGFTGRLTVTQLDATSVTVTSSGNALPDAVILGAGGLSVPTEVIISADETPTQIDLTDPADVAANTFDPTEDGIDFYEALEGMRVTIPDAVAVAPYAGFGEVWTVADGGAGATGFNMRGSIAPSEGDLNPERIQIQINSDVGPDIDVSGVITGDLLGTVTGVVDYNFGNYEVVATEIGAPVSGGLTPEVTTLQGSENQLSVASYNVYNLDPSDTDQIARLAAQIVNNLLAPDVLALQEVQDNNGTGSGTTASDETLQALIDAIVLAGGPEYSFAVIDPVGENTQGGVPNGNIRVAYLYNDDRVDLVEGSLTAVNETLLTEAGVTDADAFNGSRLPLEVQFAFNGEVVTIINNHFYSKGGSDDLFGANQPAEENGADRREEQATALNDYVDTLLASDPDANIVVVGDFNDFEFSDPLDIIEGGAGDDQILFNQVETIAIDEDRYSYIYQGNAGTIDQFLVTENLVAGTDFDMVHINADFTDPASDHDPILGLITLGDIVPEDPVFAWGSNGADMLTGSKSGDVIWARGGDDTLIGYGGNDVLGASSGADFVDAGAGNDLVYGGSGRDTVLAGEGNDLVFGSSGSDQLFGDDGDDILYGGNGTDLLEGGDGDDVLRGSNGADTLIGGVGDDHMYGGRGDDEFVFAAGSGTDEIRDFDPDDDLLNLSETATDFTDAASVLASATEETVNGSSGVLIDLGGGDSVFLRGVDLDDLNGVSYTF